MAIESAWVLAKCIEESEDFNSAFIHYVKQRKVRTDLTTKQSMSIGNITVLKNRIGIAIRNFVTSLIPNSIHEMLHRKFIANAPMYKVH